MTNKEYIQKVISDEDLLILLEPFICDAHNNEEGECLCHDLPVGIPSRKWCMEKCLKKWLDYPCDELTEEKYGEVMGIEGIIREKREQAGWDKALKCDIKKIVAENERKTKELCGELPFA